MWIWNAHGLLCVLGTYIVTTAQRGAAPGGACEFHEYKDEGSFAGLSEENATEMFYRSRKPHYTCTWHIFVSRNTVKLLFDRFKFSGIWPDCNQGSNITIVDYSRRKDKNLYSVTYCGTKKPPPFYSSGSEVDVIVRGNLEKFMLSHDLNIVGDFHLLYVATKKPTKPEVVCGACGGKIRSERGRLYSPSYPQRYPPRCDCSWELTVREGNFIKIHFLSFSLEKKDNSVCRDYTTIYDGTISSSTVLGRFCGDQVPGDVRTTGRKAVVHFFSDFSTEAKGFSLIYESAKEERDLSGLRSIAAILGGVSFGIFVFLLLCSVLYKRYVGDQQTQTACGENCDDRGDDYIDAVQAGAPPSYQIVMAAPDMYPRTPDVSPGGSPSRSPNSSPTPSRRARPPRLRHTGNGLYVASDTTLPSQIDATNLPLTPPPPYSAIVRENQESFEDYPPPPSYAILSDSSDVEDSANPECAEQSTHEPIADEDSAALLPSGEQSSRTSKQEGPSQVPQIGRLSLSDAVTNWRNRDMQNSRADHNTSTSSNTGSVRRFLGSRSLSNFFHSSSLKGVRRQGSDGGIWSRRTRTQNSDQFAVDLAMSLSALRQGEEDANDIGDGGRRARFSLNESEDNISNVENGSAIQDNDEIMIDGGEASAITPGSSFDRFTLSRHNHAASNHADIHSLCSDNESMRSMDRLSTQSDSSRQYLVNLSGRDKSIGPSNHKRSSRSSGKRHYSRGHDVGV